MNLSAHEDFHRHIWWKYVLRNSGELKALNGFVSFDFGDLINLNKMLKSNIPSYLKCPCHILSTIFPILFDSKIGHPGIYAAISYPVLPFESFWLKRNLIYFSSEVDSSIFLHIVINLFETFLHFSPKLFEICFILEIISYNIRQVNTGEWQLFITLFFKAWMILSIKVLDNE